MSDLKEVFTVDENTNGVIGHMLCIVSTEEEAIKRTRALNKVFSSEVTLNENKTDMELTPENIETVNNDLYCYFNYKEYLVDS